MDLKKFFNGVSFTLFETVLKTGTKKKNKYQTIKKQKKTSIKTLNSVS